MNILINDVTKKYDGGKVALKNINLKLEGPCLVGLLGPNGAGKTSLMKMLVASSLPTKGEIIVNGTNLRNIENRWKKHLGYLPQSFGLYDELKVREFLDYMAALKEIPKNKAKKEVNEVIHRVNLDDKANAKIRTLSGGQRQRVGIAETLLSNPDFLIFDEPTVGLDPQERIHFQKMFKELSKEKLIILSTHILEDVESICNKLVIIKDGEVRYEGNQEELLEKENCNNLMGAYLNLLGEAAEYETL